MSSRFVHKYTGSEHRDFQRGGTYYATDPGVNKGVIEADKAMKLNRHERLESLVVVMAPSDSEDEHTQLTSGINFDGRCKITMVFHVVRVMA